MKRKKYNKAKKDALIEQDLQARLDELNVRFSALEDIKKKQKKISKKV